MTRCNNTKCFCQPDKRSWKCRLGFHDYHLVGNDWLCIRQNCDMMDLGVGEVHKR